MRAVSLGLLALLAVYACGAESGPSGPVDPVGEWQLESGTIEGEPVPIVEGHPITLSADGGALGGTAACNGYGGMYTVSGNAITLSDLVWTEMACMPQEVMESERLYLEGLGRVETFEAGEDTLTLAGEGVELFFIALPPVPTAELTGTVWVLDSLVDGDAVSAVAADRATLELFSDGSTLGSTGCRDFRGNYTVSGSELALTELEASGDCPQELEPQDGQVLAVLGDGARFQIEETTLTLSGEGDQGLVYRAER